MVKKKWPTDKVPRKRWCLKVPKEVYTDDFRNEVEVPRSIMETGDRTQKMLHWKEGVATESLTVRLSEGGEAGPLLMVRRPGNVRNKVAGFPTVGDCRLKADRWQSLHDGCQDRQRPDERCLCSMSVLRRGPVHIFQELEPVALFLEKYGPANLKLSES